MIDTLDDAYQAMDLVAATMATEAVNELGVPTTPMAAVRMAEHMYPALMEHRARIYAIQKSRIEAMTPGYPVAPPRHYPVQALTKLIMRAAGLMPGAPMQTTVSLYDEATRRMLKQRVAPWTAPTNAELMAVMARRVGSGVARHVKQGSRDAVLDTARKNDIRWARKATGRETCSFCMMLVGRGAVYYEHAKAFQTHDHCDCTAVLVPDRSKHWEGKDEADEIYRLWRRVDAESMNNADAQKKFDAAYRQLMGGRNSYGRS